MWLAELVSEAATLAILIEYSLLFVNRLGLSTVHQDHPKFYFKSIPGVKLKG